MSKFSSFFRKLFKQNKIETQNSLGAESVSINEKVEIFGHRLDLCAIRELVNISAPYTGVWSPGGKRQLLSSLYISQEEPKLKIHGLHVLEIYDRFPCFDEHDYAYENRYYHYYFFSRKRFSEKRIAEIMLNMSSSDIQNNSKKLRPVVYYSDGMDAMLVAL